MGEIEIQQIPIWFKYAHCVIWIVLIVAPFFIYQVFKNAFGANAGAKHSKHKGIILKFSKATKRFLLISVTLSYSYVITTSIQSLFMFITSPNTLTQSSHVWCPLFASYRMFSYCTGRVLLYTYFIFRTNDIFNGTYLEFGKCNKYGLVSYLVLIIISLVLPSAFIYFFIQSWSVTHDANSNGTYCLSADTNGDGTAYIKYVFVWGSLNDMIFATITIFMTVSRLFLLLINNESKKAKREKYQFSSNSKIEDIPDMIPVEPVHAPTFVFPDSADPYASTEKEKNDDDNDRLESPRSLDSPRNLDTPRNQRLQSRSVSPRSASSKKVKISASDAMHFHHKTYGHNRLILLISKFFIILTCVVFSSQVVLVLFLMFRDLVLILYSMDTIINIVCLWLTFGQTDHYYNKYCCGKCCTKCCFPCIKTVTLSCNQYYETEQAKNKRKRKSKCMIYCQCCCFSSCRYCCSSDETPKEIFKLARLEIELIIASNDEKSLTMEAMSSNHSRKDVVSSIDKSNISANGPNGVQSTSH